jgi:antitoxin component YwqK of YwqJK toxin-antitoxin module|tara:strand:+ start:87 stop:1091 length:1005 start_codon:yes stop_codon:yes gene_type:complete
MKQSIIILTSIFLSLSSFGQEFKTATIDGILKKDTVFVYPKQYDFEHYQGFVKDSLPTGKWVAYFEDSASIAFTGHYKNGKPNGLFQYYFKNGKVRHTCVYKDGIENGPFTYWDKGGAISMIGQKVNDKNEGVWYDWWSNGNIRKYYIWENGIQNGIDKYFNSNGTLDRIGKYSNGYQIGEWRFYYKNGQLKKLQFFVDSLSPKELKVISKYENTIATLYFPVGTWKEWDEKGNLISETNFDGSYEIDKQTYYYPSGAKKTETNFQGFHQGFCSQNPSYFIKNGLFQEWHENGKPKTTGMWENNIKEGNWTYFTNTGNIEKIEVYKNEELIEVK